MSLSSHFKSVIYIANHPFNQGQKIKALWKWFRWQLGSRLVAAPVMLPWIDKTVLVARNGETGVTQNIYCGLHEFSEMGFVLHFLRAGDCFIDVGANSGVYSILAAGACGASGIAVEPVPSTFSRLTRHLAANQLGELVQAKNVGVADTPGELYFSTDSDTTNKIVPADWTGPKQLLPVTTLDDLCDKEPALMKIDVEGRDEAVLLGAKKTLNASTLKAIIIEISPASVPILSAQGFAPCSYDPFSRKLSKLGWDEVDKSPNVIAVRDLEMVQKRLRNAEVRFFHGKRF